MNKLIFVLGAGGHASVLVDILKQQKMTISGLFSKEGSISRSALSDIPTFNDEDEIFQSDHDAVSIVNGIGSLPSSSLRTKLYRKFHEQGYSFLQVISPKALVSNFATLGEGVQVMPGAIIQAGATIGDNTIINTGAIIEHDCVIGNHCHIAPGVTLSGQVTIGDFVHIGTGANVIQNVSIGDGAIIGAGANIINSVSARSTIFGIRAEVKNNEVNESQA